MTEMRLQRVLALAGVASRRAAEELIEAGRVKVDGRVASRPSMAAPNAPTVEAERRRVSTAWSARLGWRRSEQVARRASKSSMACRRACVVKLVGMRNLPESSLMTSVHPVR